ncbi:Voltage-dependent T-type calcium channel subunit alpha-1H [Symbiodinium microadriaticum]|uniref:Voltage-dependent T-type calcium channel subunit alpha-1H n=1 Tax=Symbiodinium microadriaticum TaxID=2951 RepID=A0A1Q9CH71_SYMMI|nr:Voltage-dependent T-type calcium channel subunit alpha-1H [Symbiodinium microadriaticum]CAE7815819.1 Cacna1h [Symbiodinium microadriaticum]CAE7909223.1 Cacna1h [Symbiodinium sp. KB8]
MIPSLPNTCDGFGAEERFVRPKVGSMTAQICLATCDGLAGASFSGHNSSDFLVKQYSDEDGSSEIVRAIQELSMLQVPEEVLANAKEQQQLLQAALLHISDVSFRSRAVLAQLKDQLTTAAASKDQVVIQEPCFSAEAVSSDGEQEAVKSSAFSQNAPPEAVVGNSAPDSARVATVLQQSSFRRQATSDALRDHIRNETRANIPAWSEGIGAFLHKASVRIVHSWVFELYILAAIVLNSVIIGIESELRLDDGKLEWAAPVEVVLLGIYTIEIVLRVLAGGAKVFCEGWFLFDLSLVVFSYLERIIAGVAGEAQQQIIVLRLLRLFRLIRSFRMVKQIKPLWRLVHGLMASADTVLSTLMLLLLVLYVFGVLGLELIAVNPRFQSDPAANAVIRENFSSLGMSMVTLTQFITMDNISAIYLPMVKLEPAIFFFFAVLILIVSVSVMNLVTAALVEGSMEHARALRKEDDRIRSANTKTMLPEILKLFDLADADGSGEIAIEEMREFESNGQIPDQLLDQASVGSMTELFNVLDVDKSGVVTREEFVEGLMDILLRDVPVSQMQQLKMLRLIKDSITDLESKMRWLEQQSATL